jgi:hypothetical protein
VSVTDVCKVRVYEDVGDILVWQLSGDLDVLGKFYDIFHDPMPLGIIDEGRAHV